MEFRELGKSGIRVSAIGLGTWQWGSREWGWGHLYGRKELHDAIDKAIEMGINLIDTAEVYGGGRSEQIIGEAMRGHREHFVIATKAWPLNVTPRRLRKAADRSLKRLGIDTIDLYQVHWPNPLVPIRKTMKAMRELVREGKVRCVGVSNFNLKRMAASQHALVPLELTSNQVRYNILDRRIEADLLPNAQREKITIIAYSPLAQALLTGKYTAEHRPHSFVQRINPKFSPSNLTRLGELNQILREISQAHGKTPSQVALNWLITKENVIAIPGVKGPQHVIDMAGAMDWRLSDDQARRIEIAAAQVRFNKISGITSALRALTP
jgi:aryl-alcohol dehydrogenase-like predicted oxidoreductase